MRACLLNIYEADKLERDGQIPSCSNHTHIQFFDALEGVTEERYRWVTSDASSKRRVVMTRRVIAWEQRASVMRDKNNRVIGVYTVLQAIKA